MLHFVSGFRPLSICKPKWTYRDGREFNYSCDRSDRDDPYLIRGIHGLFYTSKPEEARAFVRDKLNLPNTDVGDGWLIFDFPEGDMGFHPIEAPDKIVSGKHEISFYCDDIKGTVATLKKRGVVFDEEISDAGFGLITYLTIPGNVRVMLYEPKYTKNKSKDKKSIPAIPKRSSHRR